MNTVIWTTATAILVLLALAVHEIAHAVVLRGYGVPIDEAGLGLPFPPRIVLRPTRRRHFRLSFSPWLIGAYVSFPEKHIGTINALPYRDRAWYAGAGITANLVSAGALWVIVDVITGRWQRALIIIAVTVAIVVWRKHVTAYLYPALGLPALALLAWSLADTFGQPQGPVGFVQLAISHTPMDALIMGWAVSLSIALLNLIPLYPFDGGRIADYVIGGWFGDRIAGKFRVGTGVCALALLIYAFGSDFGWLVMY